MIETFYTSGGKLQKKRQERQENEDKKSTNKEKETAWNKDYLKSLPTAWINAF